MKKYLNFDNHSNLAVGTGIENKLLTLFDKKKLNKLGLSWAKLKLS